MSRPALAGVAFLAAALLGGCAIETAPTAPGRTTETRPAPTNPPAGTKTVDAAQVARLKKAMIPLLAAMDKPIPPNRVKVGIVDDASINAANAGNGEFYVTTGLLSQASDDQLLAVMAHEVAHEDLGHVAKAQALGTGLNIGAVLLDQIFPGVGQIAPVAGTLITRAYSRREELAADRHGVTILKRAGWQKESMERTLVWLKSQTGGGSSGGFFSTHPGTDERIAALRDLK